MKRYSIALLPLSLLPACASIPKQPPTALLAVGELTTVDHSHLNSRLLEAAAQATFEGELPLGPGDLLEISVFDVPEFSGIKVRVSPAGTVMLPLLGSVKAGELTPDDVIQVPLAGSVYVGGAVVKMIGNVRTGHCHRGKRDWLL